MKFSSRLLAATSAVALLTSGMALVASGPASALPTRLEGPFLTTSTVGSGLINTWSDFQAGQPITLHKSVSDVSGAAVISFPKPGTTGVIRGTGAASDLCITAAATLVQFATTTAEVCDGSPLQQWSITTDGQMLFAADQSFGLSDYTADNTIRMMGGPSGPQAWDAIILTNTAPIVAPVTAEVVSRDDAGRSTVISGSGEPGASIVITPPDGPVTVTVDPDGRWTATIPGLAIGANTLPIVQEIDGKIYGTTSLAVVIAAPPVTTPTSTPTPGQDTSGGPRVETGGSTVAPSAAHAGGLVQVGRGAAASSLAALGIWFAARRLARR